MYDCRVLLGQWMESRLYSVALTRVIPRGVKGFVTVCVGMPVRHRIAKQQVAIRRPCCLSALSFHSRCVWDSVSRALGMFSSAVMITADTRGERHKLHWLGCWYDFKRHAYNLVCIPR